MYLVLCYDVTDDKRRGRLYRRLKGYLAPVQRSVFEGALEGRRYAGLTRMICRTVDLELDTVRIYHLGQTRPRLIELLGTARPVTEANEDEVF